MDKLNMQTTNIVDENIQKIGKLFPNCLTERLNDEALEAFRMWEEKRRQDRILIQSSQSVQNA